MEVGMAAGMAAEMAEGIAVAVANANQLALAARAMVVAVATEQAMARATRHAARLVMPVFHETMTALAAMRTSPPVRTTPMRRARV
jgi:hypothetical protein